MDSLVPVLLSGFWLISAFNYFGVQIASDLGQQKSLQTSSCALLACLHILWAHLSSSKHAHVHQFSLVAQSCLTLQLHGPQHPSLPCPSPTPELAQTQVHRVSDAIQPSHSLSSPFPPAFNLSQHQGLFQWVSCSHQVANKYTLYIYNV